MQHLEKQDLKKEVAVVVSHACHPHGGGGDLGRDNDTLGFRLDWDS